MSMYKQDDYRDVIQVLLEEKIGRGSKTQLAEVLNCQPGYISQVLNKSKIHFSPENVIKVAAFLELSPDGTDYLLNLLHFERAGSKDLKDYYEEKIRKMQKEHLRIDKQIKEASSELDESAKGIYYSHWAYVAVHMLVSIKNYGRAEDIAKRLKIGLGFTTKILDFLENKNLVEKNKVEYSIGKTRIHLKGDSPHVKSHHQNYRNKAILSLQEDSEFNLHYSSVMTLSKKDAQKIKDLVLKLIKDKEVILIPSPDETMICFNFDLIEF